MTDYTQKVRDLLALAESPNEHEARAALLKARELMAKYKISQAQVEGKEDDEVVRKPTGVDYSLRRDPWISDLAGVIAKYHCCRNIQYREKGRQVAEIWFIGLSDDTAVCMDVFRYAVDCVRSKTKKLRKQSVEAANGYGYGFVCGLNEAYNKQQAKEGWGLVLVVPEAVNEEVDKLKKKKVGSSRKMMEASARYFHKGVTDGHKFHEQKRIKKGGT